MNKIVIVILLVILQNTAQARRCDSVFLKSTLSQLELLSQREKLAAAGVDFFANFLRIPTNTELAKYSDFKVKASLVDEVIGDRHLFWENAFAQNPKKLEDARMLMMVAYHDFIKGAKSQGVTPRSATSEEFFAQLMNTYRYLDKESSRGEFKWKHVQRILGERVRQAGEIPYPILFEGVEGLRRATQEKFPNSFKGIRDARFGIAYNKETLKLIVNKYRGVIAVSILGGVPWDIGRLQFESLKLLAKARNLLIVVKEVNGETDLIPREILDYEHTRILTNTVDLGDELRILGGLVVIPTNPNPLTGLQDGRQSRVRGQTQIVFGTQRTMKTVATELNHISSHDIWSTGTLNDPELPYANYRSSRVTTLASARLINSVVIAEKSDAQSGPNNRGAPGRWHVRAADFENATSDAKYGTWDAGTADNFMFYPADGSQPRPIPAVAVVPGDYHSGFEDPRFLRAIKEQILDESRRAGRPVEFMRYHDFYDIGSVSPYDSPSSKAIKHLMGELDLQHEINRGRSDLNSLLVSEPQMIAILSEADNHHIWLSRMFNDMNALNDPINGPFLAKLREMHLQGFGPLDYLLRRQKDFDEATPEMNMRMRLLGRNVYVENPDRVRVLREGESLFVGPVDRAVNIAPHGHKIAGGARGGASLVPHASANSRVIVGHTHTAAIWGNAYNVAMSVRLRSQPYALGGYSAQKNSVAVVYLNGAIQLFNFDPFIGRLTPDLSAPTLPGRSFFTSEPFVIPDPNDRIIDSGATATTLTNYNSKSVR